MRERERYRIGGFRSEQFLDRLTERKRKLESEGENERDTLFGVRREQFLDRLTKTNCSRLKSLYEFYFEGFSNFSAFQLKGCFKSKMLIQEYKNEIQNSY